MDWTVHFWYAKMSRYIGQVRISTSSGQDQGHRSKKRVCCESGLPWISSVYISISTDHRCPSCIHVGLCIECPQSADGFYYTILTIATSISIALMHQQKSLHTFWLLSFGLSRRPNKRYTLPSTLNTNGPIEKVTHTSTTL